MNIFDGAKNMTLPATWTQEERDEFTVIDVTQSQMDELSGREGFLTQTVPEDGRVR